MSTHLPRRAHFAALLAGACLTAAMAPPAHAQVPAPSPLPAAALVCDQPAGDPDPLTDPDAWRARDLQNIACATQRQQDALTNPAFLRTWAVETGIAYPQVVQAAADQLAEPTRPHVSPIYWNPAAKVGDPFRIPERWEAAGRGQMTPITFVAKTGAKLNARIYSPNPRPREGRLPGVTFTPGLQSYNEVNAWVAEGLAEAGYIVLIVDPQGQGSSENLPHRPDGSIDCSVEECPNVPTNDFPETESAIDFLLSTPSAPYPWAQGANAAGTHTFNPLWARLDATRVGIAGHSLGAIAATPIGQIDQRVKAVVSYDNLDDKLTADAVAKAHAPTLYFGVDYAFPSVLTPYDPTNPPEPRQHMGDLDKLVSRGVDAMSVTTRASTHYEFGYQPFPASFQASRYGERIAFHYTLAWFDRYLKGDRSATARLTTLRFDGSADTHSIGAGTYDHAKATLDPANPRAGNLPYTLAGRCAADLLSFYFRSAYRLDGGRLVSDDMRSRGC